MCILPSSGVSWPVAPALVPGRESRGAVSGNGGGGGTGCAGVTSTGAGPVTCDGQERGGAGGAVPGEGRRGAGRWWGTSRPGRVRAGAPPVDAGRGGMRCPRRLCSALPGGCTTRRVRSAVSSNATVAVSAAATASAAAAAVVSATFAASAAIAASTSVAVDAESLLRAAHDASPPSQQPAAPIPRTFASPPTRRSL